MSSPETRILSRTLTILQTLAAQNKFVPVEGERCRQVHPSAIRQVRALEGSEQTRTSGGVGNISLPAILVSALPVDTATPSGVSTADDEVVRVAILIIENCPQSNLTTFKSFSQWQSIIRQSLLVTPNPFLQDASPTEYDPYVVQTVRRTSVDPAAFVRSAQVVAQFVFQVMVRHPRGA